MSHNIHEPIKQTIDPGAEAYNYLLKKFKQIVIGGGILVALSLASILIQADYWKGLIYTVPLTIIVVWVAIILYPEKSFKEMPKRYFKFDENGIYEEIINAETNEVEQKQSIPFASMNRILIGNFVRERESEKKFSKNYYEFGALMVIEHDDGQYLETFDDDDLDKFRNWLPRFLDKNCNIVKTEYDLAPAFYDSGHDDMNVSGITVESWQEDDSYPPIGKKNKKNPYVPWEPHA